jgi:hypothetical protein
MWLFSSVVCAKAEERRAKRPAFGAALARVAD